MFKALSPILAQRKLHLLLSLTSDGRISVFVEPVKLAGQEGQ